VITVSTFYLTAQMVGGGVLVKTLIGINNETSVVAVGVLMLGYVPVRRHGGHDLGANHQGGSPDDRNRWSIVRWCGARTAFLCPDSCRTWSRPEVQARVATLLGDPAKNMSAPNWAPRLGIDDEYRTQGRTFFTVESRVKHLAEARAGEAIYVTTQLSEVDDKRLHVRHRSAPRVMTSRSPRPEQVHLYVDTAAGRAASMDAALRGRLDDDVARTRRGAA